MSSKLLSPNRATDFDAHRLSPDLKSKAEMARYLPLHFPIMPEDFSHPAEKFDKLCLKRISAPAKLEMRSPKDSPGATNKVRKMPLKRISGLSKSNLRPPDYPKTLKNNFITYDPYLPRPSSSENYSFLRWRQFEMLSDLELPHVLINDAAKMELQHSFMSAQRRYYLNRQGKI